MRISHIVSMPLRVTLTIILTMMLSPSIAGTVSVCSGGDRAAHKLTCIVDGETGWDPGVMWRRYGRDLAKVILSDGCDAGQVLIIEGLSQPWPNSGNR